jgi:hypothetical protein
LAHAYGGSNPPLPILKDSAGIAQLVELHPSKVVVVSSSLIARFWDLENAHVAQSVEHILGKDEVHRFDPGRGLCADIKRYRDAFTT